MTKEFIFIVGHDTRDGFLQCPVTAVPMSTNRPTLHCAATRAVLAVCAVSCRLLVSRASHTAVLTLRAAR